MPDSLGGILTDGMGADFNGLILGPFRLKITAGGPPFVPPGGGPGGSGGAGTGSSGITTGFPPHQDSYEEAMDRKRLVKFEVKMGEKILEKDFMVSVERADKMVQLVKWANKMIVQTQFRIGKFKRKYGTITARFKKKDQ